MTQYKREPLTEEQIVQLRAACRTRKEAVVIGLLLETGLRLRELTGLARARMELEARPPRMRVLGKVGRGLARQLGPMSKLRVIPLSPEAVTLLREHFAADRTSFGIPPRTVNNIVRRCSRRAGLPRLISPHVLRHTFAVRSIRRGLNPRVLQAILGHESIKTTEIYMRLSPEDVLNEFNRTVKLEPEPRAGERFSAP